MTATAPHVWGCRHVSQDDSIHVGGWGARLIYGEVRDGMPGVVWDRQNGWGDTDAVKAADLLGFVDAAMRRVGWTLHSAGWGDWRGSAEQGLIVYRDGLRLFVASPQGSYGYLYVTALLERPEAYGRTQLPTAEQLTSGADVAHVVGHGAWSAKRTADLRAAVRAADDAWRLTPEDDAHRRVMAQRQHAAAEKELVAFLDLWPEQPAKGPARPVATFAFAAPPARGTGRAPVWLHAIWNSQDAAIVGTDDPVSPFVGGGLDFDTPGITWDGRVAEAEVYTQGGDVKVRIFHHDDGTVTWEVYDEAYVEKLDKAVDAAMEQKGRNER